MNTREVTGFAVVPQVVLIYEKKKPTWFILLSERIPAFSPPPAVSW